MQAIDRRHLLTKGLWGGALLSLGGLGFLLGRSSRELSPRLPVGDASGAGPPVLDGTERAVVEAIARRLVPASAPFPSLEEARVVEGVEFAIAALSPDVQRDLRRLLRLFENGLTNFLFGGRTLPFTRLGPEVQDAVLEEWRLSALSVRRTGYLALRTLVMAAYYASPTTWPAIGYAGPPKGVHQPGYPVWRGGGAPRPGRGGKP